MENQMESEREERQLRHSDSQDQQKSDTQHKKIPTILNFYMQSSVLENITQLQS